MQAILAAEPLAQVDYLSAADPITLAEIDRAQAGILLSLAVRIGKTRLIDNILLSPGSAYAARD